MKPSLLSAVAAASFIITHGFAAETKSTTLPNKQYTVVCEGTPGVYGQPKRIVGTIPLNENASIVATATKVEVAANGVATVGPDARVDVLIAGKVAATFSTGPNDGNLVLTPWVGDAKPLSWEESWAVGNKFSQAFAEREFTKLSDFLMPDARISVEEYTATGLATKELSKSDYLVYVQNIAPKDSKIVTKPEGGNSEIADDGQSARVYFTTTFEIYLPNGTMNYPTTQSMTVKRAGNELKITALSITVPERYKQDRNGPFGIRAGRR